MKQTTIIHKILWGTLLTGIMGAASAADFTVDQVFDGVDANPGDGTCATVGGNCTLRAAVMETNALAGADTITLPTGTYNLVVGNSGEDLSAEGDLDILDDLTITGADPATTILTGNTNQFRVFSVLKRADTTLPIVSISNVTLTQGMAGTNGAVLYNEGELTLENVTVDNASVDSAPIYNSYGSLSVNNSRITNNAGGVSGGVYSQYGSLGVNNSIFDSNTNGSAIYLTNSTAKINNSTFSSNATNRAGSGGAIYHNSYNQLTIDNSQFNGNSASRGGAIYSFASYGSSGELKVSNSSFDSNSSTNAGLSGGALYFANGVIIDTSITNNTATGMGGGIYSAGLYSIRGSVILKRVTLTGNQASQGGAAWLSGSINVSDSVIIGNSASSHGGGLALQQDYIIQPISVRHTEISANSAAYYGGGIYTTDGNVQFENITISGNSAAMDGGGLYHSAGATEAVQLTHVTLAANTAPSGMGGNIANATGIMRLSNSVVASTGGGLNCTGTITTLGYNLDSSNTCGLGAEGDQASTNPLVDILANNGGSTQTHALLTGSPAIDAGNSVLCASNNGLDQRYFYRGDGACDIGAYEADSVRAQSGTLAFSVANLNVNETDDTATVTVSRTGGSEGDVSIWYEDLQTGTASSSYPYDYTAITRSELQWPDGDAADKTFDITLRDNSNVDGDKTINLTLNTFTNGGAIIGTQNTTTVTITDDESIPGDVSFDAATYAVAENGYSINITVERLNGNAPVSIDYTSSDDTAIAGTDYTAISGTLDFAIGQTRKTLRIYITNNSIYEGDKTFDLTLSNPQGGLSLGQWSTSVVTIQDDDTGGGSSGAGELLFRDDLIVNEAGGTATVTVTRINGSTGTVSVDYVANIDALAAPATNGTDFDLAAGTLTFADGVTSQTITFSITDDSTVESDEGFWIDLQNPTGGATLVTTDEWYMFVTITDNDTTAATNPGVIAMETALYPSSENNSTLTYALTRTGGTDGVVSVDVTFEDGSALFGTDYNASSQSFTATFQDGESRITGTVSIIDDSTVETEESFIIRLSNPQGGATLGSVKSSAVAIADNDSGSGSGGGSSSGGSSGGGGGAINPLLLLGGLLLAPLFRRRQRI